MESGWCGEWLIKQWRSEMCLFFALGLLFLTSVLSNVDVGTLSRNDGVVDLTA